MKACLLLHGWAGSTFDIENQAKFLATAGVHVVTPLLPGHGTTVKDFRTTFFSDWYTAAESSLNELLKNYSTVYIAGFSFGGVLALLLASQYTVTGVAAFSTPFASYFQMFMTRRNPFVFLAPVLQYIKPQLSRKTNKYSGAIAPVNGYDTVFCLPQYVSMMKGVALLRKEINRITCPLLLMHDLNDSLIPSWCSLDIARKSRAKTLKLHFTKIEETVTSHHMITTHRETKNEVSHQLASFITSH